MNRRNFFGMITGALASLALPKARPDTLPSRGMLDPNSPYPKGQGSWNGGNESVALFGPVPHDMDNCPVCIKNRLRDETQFVYPPYQATLQERRDAWKHLLEAAAVGNPVAVALFEDKKNRILCACDFQVWLREV